MVTTAAKASGMATIQRYLKEPFFAAMARQTDSAMAASSWLAMPNSGKSVLMPPSGSVTPISSTAPQAPTMTGGAEPGAGTPGVLLELRDEVADRVLQHEAGNARAGVDRGEDEQGLEHDGEVVPEAHHGGAADELLHDVGKAHGQGGGAAGTGDDAFLADVGSRLGEHVRG